jgi:ATP-dependent Clp protease ATP-binding subunit ClpA
VLESLCVDPEETRAQVEAIVGRGDEPPSSGQIPFTPEAKKAFELSLREALALGHNHIGTEHVLLGLMRIEDGVATQILAGFDVDAERVRRDVTHMLASAPVRGLRWRGRDFAPGPPEWEYRVERAASAAELSEPSLDELGADAWELVSIATAGTGLVLVFKRRRRRD